MTIDMIRDLRSAPRSDLSSAEADYRDMEVRNAVERLTSKHKNEDEFLTDVASELIQYLKNKKKAN